MNHLQAFDKFVPTFIIKLMDILSIFGPIGFSFAENFFIALLKSSEALRRVTCPVKRLCDTAILCIFFSFARISQERKQDIVAIALPESLGSTICIIAAAISSAHPTIDENIKLDFQLGPLNCEVTDSNMVLLNCPHGKVGLVRSLMAIKGNIGR